MNLPRLMNNELKLLCILLWLGYCQAQDQSVSHDGNCGAAAQNQTCIGSTFGNCCSSKGYCGATPLYCGAGCLAQFGQCSETSDLIDSNAICGTKDGRLLLCLDSPYGPCCSSSGYCGSTDNYCGSGCQPQFGLCAGANTSTTSTSFTQLYSPGVTPTSRSSVTTTSSATSNTVHESAGSSIAVKIAIKVLGSILVLIVITALVFWIVLRKGKRRRARATSSGEDGRTKRTAPDVKLGEVPVQKVATSVRKPRMTVKSITPSERALRAPYFGFPSPPGSGFDNGKEIYMISELPTKSSINGDYNTEPPLAELPDRRYSEPDCRLPSTFL